MTKTRLIKSILFIGSKAIEFFKAFLITSVVLLAGLYFMQHRVLLRPSEQTNWKQYTDIKTNSYVYDETNHFWYDSKECSPSQDIKKTEIVFYYQGNAGNQFMRLPMVQPGLASAKSSSLIQQMYRDKCVYQYELPGYGARYLEGTSQWYNISALNTAMNKDFEQLLEQIKTNYQNKDTQLKYTLAAESLSSGFVTQAILGGHASLFQTLDLFVPYNDLNIVASKAIHYPTFIVRHLLKIKPSKLTGETVAQAFLENKDMQVNLFVATNDKVVTTQQGIDLFENIVKLSGEQIVSYRKELKKDEPLKLENGYRSLNLIILKGAEHNDFWYYHKT